MVVQWVSCNTSFRAEAKLLSTESNVAPAAKTVVESWWVWDLSFMQQKYVNSPELCRPFGSQCCQYLQHVHYRWSC